MATQKDRRQQTRRVLLDTAARLFAERGVAEASIDAIAREAGRTSGAVYDHFGSKEGLLFALLEGWVDDVAAVLSAELVNADTLAERMAALWRNVSDPAVGNGGWIALEHELWSYAARNESARAHLVERYRMAWDGLDELARVTPADGDDLGRSRGVAVLGVLLGLDMMRRADPTAVPESLAVAVLCSAAAAGDLWAPSAPTSPT